MEPVGDLLLEGVGVLGVVDLLDRGDQSGIKVALHLLPDIVAANIVKARADRDEHRHQAEGNDDRNIAGSVPSKTAKSVEAST